VFGVLTVMLEQPDLISSFQSFTELIILKSLEAHRDPEKDVSIDYKNEIFDVCWTCYFQVERAAESCATSMAGVLPAETVIRVLNPIIKTGDFPVNQAAIKMMSRVAGHEDNKDTIVSYLGDIMPGLLKV